jgi:teichuronic acid exporter
VTVGNSFADGGMYTALIRLGPIRTNDYAIALLINFVAGLLVMLGVILLSSPITNFFDDIIDTDTLVIIAPIFFVYALGVCYKVELVKNFKIRNLAVATFSAVLVSTLIMLALHFVFSVPPLELAISYFWAFSVLSTMMYCVKSSVRIKFQNLFKIGWSRGDDFYRFAATSMIVSILNSLFTNAYTLLIGNLYSTKEISFLSQATRLSQVAPSNISMIISRTNYPKLVDLRDKQNDFRYFLGVNLYRITIIMVLTCGTASLLSEQLVLILLGEEWHEMSPILKIMFLIMGFIPVNALLMQAIQTLGTPRVYMSVELIKKLNFIFMLYFVAGFPAIYFCYGLAITTLLSLALHTVVLSWVIKIKFFDLLTRPIIYVCAGGIFYLTAARLIDEAYYSAVVFTVVFATLSVMSMRRANQIKKSKLLEEE